MTEADGSRTFHLLGVPVPIQARSAAHMEALQREFELIRRSDADSHSVPARLRELIEDLRTRYQGAGTTQTEALARAAAAGVAEIDLVYEMPADAADAAGMLLQLLDEADEYCRNGGLLTLATPPEELAFRRWFLGEFVAQAAGAAPVRWPGAPATTTGDPRAAEPGSDEIDDAPLHEVVDDLPEGWALAVADGAACVTICGELDLQVAPHLRAVVAWVCRDDVEQIDLDLSGVTFLDSVGLSVLLTTHRRLGADGTALKIRPSEAVERVVGLAGADVLLAG